MVKFHYHNIQDSGTWYLQFTKDGPMFKIPPQVMISYPLKHDPDITEADDMSASNIIRHISTTCVSYGIEYDTIHYYKTREMFNKYIEARNIDMSYQYTMFDYGLYLQAKETDTKEIILFDQNHNIHLIIQVSELRAFLQHPHVNVHLVASKEESEQKIVLHLYSRLKSSKSNDKNYVALEIGGKITPLVAMKNIYQFTQMLQFMTYKSYLPIMIEPIPESFDEMGCIEWCKLNIPFYRRIYFDKDHKSYVDITPEQLTHLLDISSASFMEWMFKQTDEVDIIGDII